MLTLLKEIIRSTLSFFFAGSLVGHLALVLRSSVLGLARMARLEPQASIQSLRFEENQGTITWYHDNEESEKNILVPVRTMNILPNIQRVQEF